MPEPSVGNGYILLIPPLLWLMRGFSAGHLSLHPHKWVGSHPERPAGAFDSYASAGFTFASTCTIYTIFANGLERCDWRNALLNHLFSTDY